MGNVVHSYSSMQESSARGWSYGVVRTVVDGREANVTSALTGAMMRAVAPAHDEDQTPKALLTISIGFRQLSCTHIVTA